MCDMSVHVAGQGAPTSDSDGNNHNFHATTLVPIDKIPEQYRTAFSDYLYFNRIQSDTFNDVFNTDRSIVVSAPTGSGKTVIFELAIIRYLMNLNDLNCTNYKIVYVSPMKALCEERLVDWHRKFSPFGVNCAAVTGDSDIAPNQLVNTNFVVTTPEKWDSVTRRWRSNLDFVKQVGLFMIDEVHLLNEETRGPTLEAVMCRMKTIQDFNENQQIRFIAVSATIPNVEDIAEWLSFPKPAKHFSFGDETRPVKLTRIVQGYPYNPQLQTPFKFDLMLSYKLHGIMLQHANGKPTLIFCSTRKSVEMTAKHLMQNLTIRLPPERKLALQNTVLKIQDASVKEPIVHGIGCHHAGMLPENRKIIEDLFRNGDLPILVTTSTLAMGVNLPAHLVIIKSTKQYIKGEYRDYSESSLLQMIGRAGRPQYDLTATAIVLTTLADKTKFENMIGGTQKIESSLHKNLTNHLNAEIVLRTITDIGVALNWLRSTYLCIRARKHPKYYGFPAGLTPDQVDGKLLDICQIEINKLARVGMITLDENMSMAPTIIGSLMANYCIHFETMKLFTQITGTEVLHQILNILSRCHEYSDLFLRINDKKALNLLNKCKDRATIRFPLTGKIRTLDMKINCIIQAVLGCLEIKNASLFTEAQKIMRTGQRIVKCLHEYLETKQGFYTALLNALIMVQCFNTKIWENSPYVSKQLTGIGEVMSASLVAAGKTDFQKLLESNPRNLEMIIHRKSPMGNAILDQVKNIPRYEMTIDEIKVNRNESKVRITIKTLNFEQLKLGQWTVEPDSVMHLLVGDQKNNVLVREKYRHTYFASNSVIVYDISDSFKDNITLYANLICENLAGIDCKCELELFPFGKENMLNKFQRNIQMQARAKPNATLNNTVQKYVHQYFKVVKNNFNNQPEAKSNRIENRVAKDNMIEEKLLLEIDNEIFEGENLDHLEEQLLQSPDIPENILNPKNKITIISDVQVKKADQDSFTNETKEGKRFERKDLTLDDIVSTQFSIILQGASMTNNPSRTDNVEGFEHSDNSNKLEKETIKDIQLSPVQYDTFTDQKENQCVADYLKYIENCEKDMNDSFEANQGTRRDSVPNENINLTGPNSNQYKKQLVFKPRKSSTSGVTRDERNWSTDNISKASCEGNDSSKRLKEPNTEDQYGNNADRIQNADWNNHDSNGLMNKKPANVNENDKQNNFNKNITSNTGEEYFTKQNVDPPGRAAVLEPISRQWYVTHKESPINQNKDFQDNTLGRVCSATGTHYANETKTITTPSTTFSMSTKSNPNVRNQVNYVGQCNDMNLNSSLHMQHTLHNPVQNVNLRFDQHEPHQQINIYTNNRDRMFHTNQNQSCTNPQSYLGQGRMHHQPAPDFSQNFTSIYKDSFQVDANNNSLKGSRIVGQNRFGAFENHTDAIEQKLEKYAEYRKQKRNYLLNEGQFLKERNLIDSVGAESFRYEESLPKIEDDSNREYTQQEDIARYVPEGRYRSNENYETSHGSLEDRMMISQNKHIPVMQNKLVELQPTEIQLGRAENDEQYCRVGRTEQESAYYKRTNFRSRMEHTSNEPTMNKVSRKNDDQRRINDLNPKENYENLHVSNDAFESGIVQRATMDENKREPLVERNKFEATEAVQARAKNIGLYRSDQESLRPNHYSISEYDQRNYTDLNEHRRYDQNGSRDQSRNGDFARATFSPIISVRSEPRGRVTQLKELEKMRTDNIYSNQSGLNRNEQKWNDHKEQTFNNSFNSDRRTASALTINRTNSPSVSDVEETHRRTTNIPYASQASTSRGFSINREDQYFANSSSESFESASGKIKMQRMNSQPLYEMPVKQDFSLLTDQGSDRCSENSDSVKSSPLRVNHNTLRRNVSFENNWTASLVKRKYEAELKRKHNLEAKPNYESFSFPEKKRLRHLEIRKPRMRDESNSSENYKITEIIRPDLLRRSRSQCSNRSEKKSLKWRSPLTVASPTNKFSPKIGKLWNGSEYKIDPKWHPQSQRYESKSSRTNFKTPRSQQLNQNKQMNFNTILMNNFKANKRPFKELPITDKQCAFSRSGDIASQSCGRINDAMAFPFVQSLDSNASLLERVKEDTPLIYTRKMLTSQDEAVTSTSFTNREENLSDVASNTSELDGSILNISNEWDGDNGMPNEMGFFDPGMNMMPANHFIPTQYNMPFQPMMFNNNMMPSFNGALMMGFPNPQQFSGHENQVMMQNYQGTSSGLFPDTINDTDQSFMMNDFFDGSMN